MFLLVGYGTKMGLAPLHTWLPDAHSEAPVGGLGPALGRAAQLRVPGDPPGPAGAAWRRGWRPSAGPAAGASALVSMVVAAVFIVGQHDYKRLLAYSSVEHMGILALGRRPRRRGDVRRAAPRRQPLAGQGDAVPRRRATSWPPTAPSDVAAVRGVLRAPAGARACCGSPGFLAITGVAAVRPVPERVHDPEGRRSTRGRPGWAVVLPGAAGASSSSGMGTRCSRMAQGTRPAEPPRSPAREPVAGDRRRRSCSLALLLARASAMPGRGRDLLSSRRRACWEAVDERARRCLELAQRRGRSLARRSRVLGVGEFRERRRRAPCAAAARLAALFGRPVGRGHRLVRGRWPTTRAGCSACSRPTVVARRLPVAHAATARRPTGSSASRRAVGRRARGHPVAQAGPLPRRRAADGGRRRRPAVVTDFFRVEGDGGPRGGGRAGPRRGHRARPLPVPVPRRDGAPPRDLARLPAPRRRAGAASAGPTSGRSTTWRRWPATRPSATPRPTPGASRRSRGVEVPRAGAGAPRRSRWSSSGSPTTSATSGRWPATSASCRPRRYCGRHPRRLPQHDRAALRQPLRPRPGAARAASAFDLEPTRAPELRDAARRGSSTTCTERGRAALGHAVGAGPVRGDRDVSRARRRGRSGWSARRRGPAASSATCAHDFPSGIYRFAQIPVSTWTTGRRVRPGLRALAGDPALGGVRRASSSQALPARADPRCAAGPLAPGRDRRSRWSRAGAARSATWR